MLCKTIELTKDLVQCPPTYCPSWTHFSQLFAKVISISCLFLTKPKYNFFPSVLTYVYELFGVVDGQYVGEYFSKSFVSSIVWQSISHVI